MSNETGRFFWSNEYLLRRAERSLCSNNIAYGFASSSWTMLSTVRHCTRTATSPITLSTVNSIIRSPHASQMVFTAAPIILLTSRTFNASFTGRRHISNHPFPGRLRVAAKSPVHYQRVSALTFSECIRITSAGRFITIRAFHASQCNRALPVIGAIFAGLKVWICDVVRSRTYPWF